MNAMEDGSADSKREKKTRRRLRLSCVECTKRRQKCDRNYPCSLCISRGVAHLCRWENVPVARPPPARPPLEALRATNGADNESIIRELSTRVAILEKALEEQKNQHPSPARGSEGEEPMSTPSPQSNFSYGDNATASTRTSPELTHHPTSSFPPIQENQPKDEDISSSDAFLHDDLYEATSTLAQLSLGHHGEYVGRGSILCALHSISTKNVPRFFYANSTDPTGAKREPTSRFSNVPPCTDIESLLRTIPQANMIEILTDGYFSESNWRFGIPEQWFRAACSHMFSVLQYSARHGAETNASWLMLLFAVLASAPPHLFKDIAQHSSVLGSDVLGSDDYFMCAMMARRIAEDDYLHTPSVSMLSSPADGTVLGCLAIPLLASYLAERGRVSEAWKLIGNGVRNAIAVGLHRDPTWKLWQIMSEDERILRRRAWWGLYIWDKLYSYLLGRPHMVRREVCDVTLPPPVDADGVRNMFNIWQALTLKLVNYITDCMDTCFCAKYPDSVTFLDMADKLSQWEADLPLEYRHGHVLSPSEGLSPQDIIMLARQRYVLYTWYLFGRLKLVVAATTGNPVRTAESPAARKECLERCIVYSMGLIKFQCDAFEAMSAEKDANPTIGSVYPGSSWLFSGCFSLFEASIALLTTLAKYTWHEQMAAAGRLIGRVLEVLSEVRRQEQGKTGETASMAIEVLTALRDEKLWKTESQTPTIHSSPESWNGGESGNSPDSSGTTPSLYMEQMGEQPSYGQRLFSQHYTVSAIRGDARTQGPKFSTNILTPDAPPPLPARLS